MAPPSAIAPAPIEPDTTIIIRTQAGGTLTQSNVDSWLNTPAGVNPLPDVSVIDVYIEQVCWYANHLRGLLAPPDSNDTNPLTASSTGAFLTMSDTSGSQFGSISQPSPSSARQLNKYRAILSMPHTFYLVIQPADGEVTGSALLRDAGISRAEFRQLENFLLPIVYNHHANLIAISPLDGTVELLDADERDQRAMSVIFAVIVRFLVHEMGPLAKPLKGVDRGRRSAVSAAAMFEPWRFLYAQTPVQRFKYDCGSYTCFFAKAMALQQPLTPETDLGQGADFSLERDLKDLVIADLKTPAWSEEGFPMGSENHVLRHYGPQSRAEIQPALFWIMDEMAARGGDFDRAKRLGNLRARTGRHDGRTEEQLVAWCRAQGSTKDRNGNMVALMQRHEEWIVRDLEYFVSMIERREAAIFTNTFP